MRGRLLAFGCEDNELAIKKVAARVASLAQTVGVVNSDFTAIRIIKEGVVVKDAPLKWKLTSTSLVNVLESLIREWGIQYITYDLHSSNFVNRMRWSSRARGQFFSGIACLCGYLKVTTFVAEHVTKREDGRFYGQIPSGCMSKFVIVEDKDLEWISSKPHYFPNFTLGNSEPTQMDVVDEKFARLGELKDNLLRSLSRTVTGSEIQEWQKEANNIILELMGLSWDNLGECEFSGVQLTWDNVIRDEVGLLAFETNTLRALREKGKVN